VILTIAHNAVNARVTHAGTTPPDAVITLIQETLSYKVEGAEYTGAFQSHQWNGRSNFYDYETHTFPTGFVAIVLAALKKAGHQVNLARRPFPPALGPAFPIVDDFPEDVRYDYQREIVEKVLRHGQIIARVATGGGKSRIARLVYKRISRPTLFLTTRGILMHQMARSVRAMGERVGILGDDEWSPVPGFNAGMVQTFAARLRETTFAKEYDAIAQGIADEEEKQILALRKKLKDRGVRGAEFESQVAELNDRLVAARPSEGVVKARAAAAANAQLERRRETLELLQKFELVILEEAHEASGNSYFDIMRMCKNAHYRLSLTGTPFMKESEEANMRLMASSGPVAIWVSEKTLIDRGILAKPYFKFIRLSDELPEGEIEVKVTGTAPAVRRVKLMKSTPWPKCYEVGVVGAIKRNAMIVYEAKRAVDHGLSVMVLVQHKKHGRLLQSHLTAAGMRANFIMGEHDQNERDAAINALKSRKIDVLIGSTILDVGVDVPAIDMVIIGSAGKAEVGTRQRIGRGLREKKGRPNVCFIVDFDDWQNNHLRDHSKQRRAIIEETPGFVEGIVNDFDYAAHGFSKVAAA
jgi:superfamily II DNA or RNA helicase